jgi:hypothetical protein
MIHGVVKALLLAAPLSFCSCALHFPEETRAGVERVEMTSRGAPAEQEPATIPVLLFSDNLHTGLVLELDWLRRHGYVTPPQIGNHRYVAFSWGDETAYVQERWLGPGQVFHALFLPSKAVMEIIPFDWNIPEVCHHQRLYQAYVPESAGRQIAGFLNHCAVRNEDGVPETVSRSSWGEGQLIRSPHSYYFPRICNIWTVDALNSMGFEMDGLLGLSADGLIRQAEKPENGFAQIWDPAWQEPDQGEVSPGHD